MRRRRDRPPSRIRLVLKASILGACGGLAGGGFAAATCFCSRVSVSASEWSLSWCSASARRICWSWFHGSEDDAAQPEER